MIVKPPHWPTAGASPSITVLVEVNTIGLASVPSAIIFAPLSTIMYEVESPVPSKPAIVVPGSIVRTAGALTTTRPSKIQFLSDVNVMSDVISFGSVSLAFCVTGSSSVAVAVFKLKLYAE